MLRGVSSRARRAGGPPRAAGGAGPAGERCASDGLHSRRTSPLIPKKPEDRSAAAGGAAAPRPGHALAAPEPTAEAELERLAREIEKYRVEADKFLVGAVEPKDFEKHRVKVVHALRELQQRGLKSAAEQFRLSSLEARFSSLSELYGRKIRDREEGRGVRPPAPAAAAPAHDPERGIQLGRDLESGAVEALLAGLVRGGGAAPDLGSFRTYLGRQLEALQQKTGASEALFRLAVEDGKMKLKVRPLGGRG